MLQRLFQRPAVYSQGLRIAQANTTISVSSVGRTFATDYIRNTYITTIKNHHLVSSKRSQPFSKRSKRQMGTASALNETGVNYSCIAEVHRAEKGIVDEKNIVSPPIELLFLSAGDEVNAWKGSLSPVELSWVSANRFDGEDGNTLCIPSESGDIKQVIHVVEDLYDIWAYSCLPTSLPSGTYRASFAHKGTESSLSIGEAISTGWILGTYSFNRYKSSKKPEGSSLSPSLIWPISERQDRDRILAATQGIFLARDMISTPAEHMAPQHIEDEAKNLAKIHQAVINTIIGEDLLKQNYPAIHTVGRACPNEPRLIDIRWSPAGVSNGLPKITLVGKGVSFDTGGLDLKPPNAMKLMKKDMGGAALVLGLAHAIMATKIPVQLRVLIPAVENSVSGNAFRPLDVLQTRAGITVENGNTDAEGRLILCDALAEAMVDDPNLVLDAATLTGAARVALGTEMPALFCNNDEVADGILKAAQEVRDYMWRMPLHKPYRKMINSKVADIGSCSEGGYAGAITAALFLEEFVKDSVAWAHVDTMGYNISSKSGRPEGGEAFALRALFEYIHTTYSS